MIESVGLAAGQFALQCVGRRWLDRRKRRHLAAAYRNSAYKTIELCVKEGYPARSYVWNRVTALLGSEEKARQVARWYTQFQISSSDLQDMDGVDPIIGRFIREFVVSLSNRLTGLLTPDQAILADVISERVALLFRETQRGVYQAAGQVAYWLGRPPSLESFVGREMEVRKLAAMFVQKRIVVISGGVRWTPSFRQRQGQIKRVCRYLGEGITTGW
jgi:hypothetical protein